MRAQPATRGYSPGWAGNEGPAPFITVYARPARPEVVSTDLIPVHSLFDTMDSFSERGVCRAFIFSTLWLAPLPMS